MGIGGRRKFATQVTSWLLACVVAIAQTTEPKELNIVILEGDGAINNLKQRVAREPVVQVEDENHKPLAGAAVTFFLPEHGASGVFANGSRSLTVMTDQSGKAVARGIRLNKASGNMQIRVNANYKGLSKSATISQQNVAIAGAAAGAISGKVIALIVVAAAGAAGGAIAATRGGGGGGGGGPAAPTTTVITPGTPSVGPPR